MGNSAVSDLKKQLQNNDITLNVDLGNTNGVQKQAQNLGRNIGQQISTGIEQASQVAWKSLSKLNTLSIKSSPVVIDGLVDAEKTLAQIKQELSEFGRVRISNKIFDNESGELLSFKANIEQINGDLKETRNLFFEINGDKFDFPKGVIEGAERYVQKLNEGKKATREIQTEAEKLASTNQEKYYGRIIANTKEIYALKQKLLSADQQETAEIQRQINNLEKRNKYNYSKISEQGLGSTDYGLAVKATRDELENRLKIKQAHLEDTLT